MKRTHVAGVAAAATLALALAGCSGGTDAAQSKEAAEPSGEPVSLTFQSLSDQPAAIATTEEIVKTWNEENPDIHVEIVPAGWDGIYDKLITQFNGGAAPDIIHYEAASIVPFARDGFLADLSPYMSEERKADIPEGVLDSVTVDGEIIAFPTEIQTYMAFANKNLLEEAGIEIPTGDTMTWDELEEMAKAATSGDVHGVGWGLKSPTATFMAMAPGFGGEFFEGSGEDAELVVGEAELALPELVDRMATVDKSILPVTLTQSGGEALATFYEEQVAITIQGSYQAANMATDAPEGLEWIVLPPLAGSVGPQQAANPQTLSVNIDSPSIPESVMFIEYFTNTENLAKLNEADALIPATDSARELLAEQLAGENGWDTILRSGEYVVSAPYLFVDAYPQWKDTVATPAFQRFLAGETDVEGLKEDLVSGWDDITR